MRHFSNGFGCRMCILSAVVASVICGASANAAVSLMGVQYQQDVLFPEYQCYWSDGNYPTSCGSALAGANVHVFIKNEGTTAVTLDDVTLVGYSLNYALKEADYNGHIANSIWIRWDNPPQDLIDAGEPAWFKMDPASIPAGGCGQVIVRLRRVPAITTIPIPIGIDTSANVFGTTFMVNASVPQLANVSYSEDLKKIYLTWRRSGGAAPATIMMDGVDITASTVTVGDPNTSFAVSVISLSTALANMSYHVYQGIYSDNATAMGGMRAWVNPFVYGSWAAFPIPDDDYVMARAWLDTCLDRGINTLEMNSGSSGLMDYLGTVSGQAYAIARNYGLIKDSPIWGTWGDNPRMWFIDDEPDIEEYNMQENFCGTGYKLPCGTQQAGTMGRHFVAVAEGLRNSKNRPTTINMDGTNKPESWYAYGQLSDCLAIDHYFQPKVRHAYYDHTNTRPLYLKAHVLYATAKMGTLAAEPNPFRQLLYSCSLNDGAPVDPWPFAPPECKRMEAYYSMAAGAKGICYWWFKPGGSSYGLGDDNLQARNPALWTEIGLLGAEIKTLRPYLVTSHPVDLNVQGSANVWVKGLARGNDTLILYVVNDDYWLDGGYHGTPNANATVTVSLPSWMLSSPTAFEATRAGINSINTSQNGGTLTLSLGTLSVGKIIFITTDPQLMMTIRQRHDQQTWQGICNFAPSVCNANTNAPSFVRHPSTQTVLAGGIATFSIAADGGGTLTYQWQKNGVNLANGGHYAGCTTPVLTVSSVDTNDVANYRCKVANSYGTATSNQAALGISTIGIAQHPSPQSVCPNANANFSVTATGSGTLTYQWQKNSINLNNGGHYSGCTTATLSISTADTTDAADYRCRVTDNTGSIYSNAAALAIEAGTSISHHPSDQAVELGATATLGVTAAGYGTLTYQWQKNNANVSDGGHYAGCATATLTVTTVDTNDAGNYRCIVTSGCGSATSNQAMLFLDPCAPAIDLYNGNFDTWPSGSVAPDWTSYSSGTAVFSKNITIFRSVPNAQRVQPPTSVAGAYGGIRQHITANQGDAITIVAWTYNESPSTYITTALGVQFDGSTNRPSSWQTNTAKQMWTSLTVAGNASSGNGATVFLEAVRGSTGTYYADFEDVVEYRAFVPSAPIVAIASTTSLNVDVDHGCNWANTQAEYAVTIGGGAYTLGTHWIQANGGIGTTVAWQTDDAWATKTVAGLVTGTIYTFKVKARYNGTFTQETALGEGATGAPGSGCTPPAAPTNAQANPAAICGGDSSQLSATPGNGGNTVEWFTGSCGGTPVAGGASPTVSPSATTTYYARTKDSATSCTSSTCATATVSVTVGASIPANFDDDCDVDQADFNLFAACVSGPGEPLTPGCENRDFDGDEDVDQSDFGVFQRCYSGENILGNPSCAN